MHYCWSGFDKFIHKSVKKLKTGWECSGEFGQIRPFAGVCTFQMIKNLLIVIYRRCPCSFIVGDQRWIKSFVFISEIIFSCTDLLQLIGDELRYVRSRL